MREKLFSDKIFLRKLWELALPIAFQNLMLASVAAADALMLGRVTQDSMGAVLGKERYKDRERHLLHRAAAVRRRVPALFYRMRHISTISDADLYQ